MIIATSKPTHICIITESQYKSLVEDVYVNSADTKKKTARLTYDRSGSKIKKGNLLGNDFLGTDKMLQNNDDTYEVPLKGGIMSYNITSISGKEVMHYFKNKVAQVQLKDENGNKDVYQLFMEDEEFNKFEQDFENKVGVVVKSKLQDFKTVDGQPISSLSIYPVPSSSDFNDVMAEVLQRKGFNGMNVQIINRNILNKDTSKLEKDIDFIKKNKEYYSQKRNNKSDFSHEAQLNTDMNRLIAHSNTKQYIDELNNLGTMILKAYYGRNKQQITPKQIERIGTLYIEYVNIYNKIIKSAEYFAETDNKMHKQLVRKFMEAIKYSKGPSIESRTRDIFNIARQSNTWNERQIKMQYPIDVCQWKFNNFQIKYLGNDTRMGLKNYFQPNNDMEMVQQEVQKAQNTAVVVFDDNVSGGATLSDICLQLKNLGINNLIPITFGKMHTQWSIGTIPIGQPENGFNMS